MGIIGAIYINSFSVFLQFSKVLIFSIYNCKLFQSSTDEGKKDFEKSSVLLRIAVTSPAFLKVYVVLSETKEGGGARWGGARYC